MHTYYFISKLCCINTPFYIDINVRNLILIPPFFHSKFSLRPQPQLDHDLNQKSADATSPFRDAAADAMAQGVQGKGDAGSKRPNELLGSVELLTGAERREWMGTGEWDCD